MSVTADQVQQAVTNGRIRFAPHHRCVTCAARISWSFGVDGGEVGYDGLCACPTSKAMAAPSWQAAADFINAQPDNAHNFGIELA